MTLWLVNLAVAVLIVLGLLVAAACELLDYVKGKS